VERAQEAQRLQEQAFDRPTMTRAAMMLASLRGAGPLMVKRFEKGGEVDLAEQMTVGTIPEGMREPGKAEEMFRALVEGGQGFLGLEPGRRGTESYRTGQALSNLPVLAIPAAAVKGTGQAAEALKEVGKKATKEGGLKRFLEGSKIQEPMYHITPKNFDEFIPGGENPELSGPGIWMTPNKEFQPAAHNVYDRSGEFRSGTNVMPLYASIKNPLVTKVSSWKEDFKPFGGGDPWSFTKDQAEKIQKAGYDGILLYDDKGNLEEAIAFKPNQVKSALGNEGTYDPKSPVITKAKGGEVSTMDFIRKRQAGSPPEGEVPTDDYIQQMTVGTVPEDLPTASFGETLTKYGISPADAVAFLGRAGSAASLAMQPSEAKAMTMDEFLASRQAALDFEGAAPNEASAARALLQAVKSRNPAQGTQAVQEMLRMYSGFGDPIKGRFDVSRADPRADMGRALYASASPDVASQSAMDRLKSKLIQPTGMAVYPLDIPKQSILFMEETYPSGMAVKLKKFANKTSVPKGPTVTGEELYQGIRTLPKEKQGEAVRLLGFKGAQFLPGGKPLSTDNFAIFDTDGTVSAITGKQFKEGGEVTQFIKAHA
jgi:hypothetical protein